MSSTQRNPARPATLSRSCTSSGGHGSGSGYGNSGGRTIAVMTAAARKVGDAETVSDEVTAGADRRFEAVEVHTESLPRSPHPRSVDPHVPAEQGSPEGGERAPAETRPGTEPIRRHARALGGAIEVRRPEETADVGRDFLVEKRLERERARALRGIGRIERPVGTPALDLGEDAIRADEGGARDH